MVGVEGRLTSYGLDWNPHVLSMPHASHHINNIYAEPRSQCLLGDLAYKASMDALNARSVV